LFNSCKAQNEEVCCPYIFTKQNIYPISVSALLHQLVVTERCLTKNDLQLVTSTNIMRVVTCCPNHL